LATGSSQVAGTQNDLELPAGVQVNARANGRPDCTVEASINKAGTSFAFRPTGCNPAAGECSVRALVLSTEDTNPISDGAVLYRCNVSVTRRGGEVAVTGVIMSTPEGTRVPGAAGRSGVICIDVPRATPTNTPTHATPTNTPAQATPTNTATHPAATATSTLAATSTPTIQATATRTRTNVSSTATATPVGGGGGGDGGGCNCAITPGQSPRGLSSLWLVLPALVLRWRRWRR